MNRLMQAVGQTKSTSASWRPSNSTAKTGIKCINMSAQGPAHRHAHMPRNILISYRKQDKIKMKNLGRTTHTTVEVIRDNNIVFLVQLLLLSRWSRRASSKRNQNLWLRTCCNLHNHNIKSRPNSNQNCLLMVFSIKLIVQMRTSKRRRTWTMI